MPFRTRSADTSREGRPSKSEPRTDNRLALLDQAFFDGHRAGGQTEVMQVMWIYEHPVDFDGLRRFHRELSHSLFGRRVERSPLPFGRHRWVSEPEPAALDIAEQPRPRAELSDWADERTQVPIDPERGPSWHLGVLPLTDGSTAVSLVASHYVLDGLGGIVATSEAIMGARRDLGYPLPHSRSHMRAVVQDSVETVQAIPGITRALVTAAKVGLQRRRDAAESPQTPRPAALRDGGSDEPVVVPGVTVYVDLDHWDARAQALGGSSSTLAAAFAAKLGEHMGRCHSSDGTITLHLVTSDRTEGDTRAVAVAFARADIDPTVVTKDLSEARAAIKAALTAPPEKADESALLAPITPITTKRTWKRLLNGARIDPDLPVVYSNLGDAGLLVSRADGTHCEYAYARGTRQHVTRGWLEQMGGQLQVLSCRTPGFGKIYITVLAYQPGAENTKPALRELIARTLAEFDVTGEID